MLKCFCVNSLKRFKAKTKRTHLVTVLLGTVQFLIGETIDVNVRPAEVAVTSPSNSTLPGCRYMHFILGSAVYQWPLLSAPGDLTKILYSLVLFWMNFWHTPDTRFCPLGGRCTQRWRGRGWADRSHTLSPACSHVAGPQRSPCYRDHIWMSPDDRERTGPTYHWASMCFHENSELFRMHRSQGWRRNL